MTLQPMCSDGSFSNNCLGEAFEHGLCDAVQPKASSFPQYFYIYEVAAIIRRLITKWGVSSASLHAYASLVDYLYSRIISLISKAKLILAANILFKYKLKLLFLINSNFTSPATNFRFNLRSISMLPYSRGIFFFSYCPKTNLIIHHFSLA